MKRTIVAGIVVLFSAALSYADDAPDTAESASVKDLPAVLPVEVLELSRYGSRFEKALEQIAKYRSQPSWGWEDTCDHVTGNTASSVNW